MATNKAIGRCRKGASLVEYGILVGLIAVLSIGAVLALGERTQTTFNVVTANLGWQIDGVTKDYPARYKFTSAQNPDEPLAIGLDVDGFTGNRYGGIAQASFDELDLRTLQYWSDTGEVTVYLDGNTVSRASGHRMFCTDLSTGASAPVTDFDEAGGYYDRNSGATRYTRFASEPPFSLGQELACVIEKK